MKQIICPVSNEKINEQITRLNAFLGILLVVAAYTFNSSFFLIVLLADFFIRAFTRTKYSPISFVSHWLTNTLRLNEKTIDKAPKIFAARLGFLMILTLTILFISNMQLATLIIGGAFILFALLEFVFAVCVGCIIYTYLVLPFYN